MENDVISFSKSGILDDLLKEWWRSSLYSGIWNWRIAIIFSLYSLVRTFTFNTWYLFYIYKRNLYSNLVSSSADLAKITSEKVNIFGLALNMDGKNLASALLILIGSKSKIWELLGLFFIQSVQLSGCLEEQLNLFGLLPNTLMEGYELGQCSIDLC